MLNCFFGSFPECPGGPIIFEKGVLVMDLPLYSVRPNVVRVLVPKVFWLIGLAVLLYFGVWLNLFVMDVVIPSYINFLVVAVIFVFVLVEVLLTYLQVSGCKYYFFAGRLEFRGRKPKTLDFRYVTGMFVSKNFFDRLLGTGTIRVEPGFVIGSISNCDKVFVYLQQLVARVRHPLLQQQQSFNR